MSIRKHKTITNRVAIALAASLVTLSVAAQTPAPRPNLVVGVMIDGLSMDYINLLQSYFGNGGFKRLLDRGVTITDLDYGTPVDEATAAAIAQTGAAPAVNGIDRTQVYDTNSHLTRNIFHDPKTMGNYTDETVSPRALLVSTIGDELRIDSDGLGYIYAIAPDQATAIILGGHSGNSTCWLNDITGNWASTTFYKEWPRIVQTRNRLMPLSERLDTLSWTNLMAVNRYPDIPAHKKAYPIRIRFSRKDVNRYKAYKESAPINTEVTSLASEYIKTMNLGKRQETDMLNLAYTVQPFQYGKDPDGRLEQMDLYLRLDRDLERLFSAIDAGPGMDKTLVFIQGTPRRSRTRRDDEKWLLPHGEFSPRRAMSLLNVYLIARHGNGEWVNGYHDRQVFLNHDLIKQRMLDIAEVRSDVASFLTRMSGVTDAYSIDDIIKLKAGINPQAVRNNTVIANSGDVFITVAPGWEIVDQASDVTLPLVERSGVTTAPGFILAPHLPATKITTPVDARIMAPTVSSILRIRSPNGAALPPLRF